MDASQDLDCLEQRNVSTDISRLKAEVSKLKAEMRYYERQNEELRNEVKLTSNSLVKEHQRQRELKEETDLLRELSTQLSGMLREIAVQLDCNCETTDNPILLMNNIGSSLQLFLSRHQRMSTHYAHLLRSNSELAEEVEDLKRQIQLSSNGNPTQLIKSKHRVKDTEIPPAKLNLSSVEKSSLKLDKPTETIFRSYEAPFNSPSLKRKHAVTGSEDYTKSVPTAISKEFSRKHSRFFSEMTEDLPSPPPKFVNKTDYRSVSPITDRILFSRLRARSKGNRRPEFEV